MQHRAAELHVTGEAQYTDDIPRQPGELSAAFVLSSRAHARILSINAEAALAYPGVRAFFSHKDVPGKNAWGIVTPDDVVFAQDEVVAVGEWREKGRGERECERGTG